MQINDIVEGGKYRKVSGANDRWVKPGVTVEVRSVDCYKDSILVLDESPTHVGDGLWAVEAEELEEGEHISAESIANPLLFVPSVPKLVEDEDPEYPDIPFGDDMVNHPNHYTSGNIECIDAIKEAINGLVGIEAFCTANAIKYLWRWKRKNGVEDLEKAKWYIERLIKELKPFGN